MVDYVGEDIVGSNGLSDLPLLVGEWFKTVAEFLTNETVPILQPIDENDNLVYEPNPDILSSIETYPPIATRIVTIDKVWKFVGRFFALSLA